MEVPWFDPPEIEDTQARAVSAAADDNNINGTRSANIAGQFTSG